MNFNFEFLLIYYKLSSKILQNFQKNLLLKKI
jgi:hypothetical protein